MALLGIKYTHTAGFDPIICRGLRAGKGLNVIVNMARWTSTNDISRFMTANVFKRLRTVPKSSSDEIILLSDPCHTLIC